ncbi:Myxococcus cysteine-rich repeat-containing protein [Nannocystis exedens]|uniref:Myxococcus cysteine-rich repeat-containing protein n=1 Tax=Nannocystis exedens TaxID=54 RepID=A0A1I1VET1_9BACT|nr:DUF4215 domain-containing protein [Nannocystis exedens]PCC72463.1 hypothetical protein NAEX_05543 [Nannocystis exedens]SFD79603.1 Myxococcus cysteine-rich repeat-containing protein [Nannocystis exedens]
MSTRAIVAVVFACAAAACFSDGGLHTTGAATTSTSTSTSTSTTGSATDEPTGSDPTTTSSTSTTGDPDPVCGDGRLDPGEQCDDGNDDDADVCRNDCQAASCGDGVVQRGVEECDDGPDNHPSEPTACRPDCHEPACGDGALYVGPLGDPVLATGDPSAQQSDDVPRAIGVDAQGTFSVAWRINALLDRLDVQTVAPDGALVGDPLDLADPPVQALRDPVIAVAPGGDLALAWEVNSNNDDIIVRGVVAGVAEPGFNAIVGKNPIQQSPAIALDDAGRLTLAYVSGVLPDLSQVFVRRIDNFDPDSPPEFAVSDHLVGVPGPPTVATWPDGAFVVAWGDPTGPIVYRRFTVDGAPGPTITSDLATGGIAVAGSANPWSGLTVTPDLRVVLGGVGEDGRVALQTFDIADVPGAIVPVADVPRMHAPFVDLGSDAWGNLAVAWAECGDVDVPVQPDCSALASDLRLRWFRADLTPHTAVTDVYATAMGAPPAIGLAVASSGLTGVTYVTGEGVVVRVAGLQCPAP